MPDVPVLTVTSIDPVLRDSAVAALLLDLPGAVAVRHDITPDGWLHRVVHDWSGVRDQHVQPLEHGCLSCALRADLLPVLRGLVDDTENPHSRPAQIIVGLPVSSEPHPLVHALLPSPGAALVPGARVAAVVATASPATLCEDLFGDELLAERGLELNPDDRRSVGEAFAAQLEYADAVLFDTSPDQRELDLLDRLAGDRPLFGLISEADTKSLLAVPRPPDDPRGDLLRLPASQKPDTEDVWTLDLHSHKPFHPGRLQAELEAMGNGPIRARGTFWLPGRPEVVGIWDGAGGQLSIGAAGTWPGTVRSTRLRVTGIGPQREAFRRAFDRALMTSHEMEQGLERWDGLDDGFDPWLGTPDDADIDDLSA
ncbi:putative cobalamin synthesis protein [Kineosporia sp. NBRC 101677]|uniref:GTP-binding protein n=1 Tax=Kineosporia sp. NBRC 101677 TaxID=3032197 RepID=UPI0024A38BF0|nr:GTP-binding protein [Kineosporia sp. NBRC 101677]GLY17390.1 putative cobalamin synthesis protein [Kineosporia sp. NBRC 101677]